MASRGSQAGHLSWPSVNWASGRQNICVNWSGRNVDCSSSTSNLHSSAAQEAIEEDAEEEEEEFPSTRIVFGGESSPRIVAPQFVVLCSEHGTREPFVLPNGSLLLFFCFTWWCEWGWESQQRRMHHLVPGRGIRPIVWQRSNSHAVA